MPMKSPQKLVTTVPNNSGKTKELSFNYGLSKSGDKIPFTHNLCHPSSHTMHLHYRLILDGRANFLNAVYFRRGLTWTLGFTNDLIDGGQPRAKNIF